MRLTYVNRRFLDYRVPVLKALDEICDRELSVIYSTSALPKRVDEKIKSALGDRAIGLSGEMKYGGADRESMANSRLTFRYQPGLFQRIRETAPDVVVGEGFFKWTAPAVVARWLRHVPLVVCYERTAYTERHVQWYRTLYRKLVSRQLDAVCCNGTLSAQYTASLGIPKQRIFTGHMAADTENLARQVSVATPLEVARLRKQWNIEGVFFLYVGQLIPRKGILELLQGWALFEQQNGATRGTLVLVGEGPQRQLLERYCSKHLLRRVRWIGAVDYSDIAEWYAAADIFIIPTLEDNWSLVVPGAMACGLPIACSKYNGCWPELVHPEQNGWIFDPKHSSDIIDLLDDVARSKKQLPILGAASKQIIRAYSPEKAAHSIFRACRHALHHA